ncbi:DEKNAAC104635 [Brettanomyces naardenensis]|uniref:Cytosolic Fe-S cluster assembly factor NAR1 n=1 Tax=Brettanomyces naardenensis TaxID=13370 RepID=A0A448YQY3_BRENA|nr:DEKNAAC104635 [Brettanomyces naardenensis]
MSALLSSDDLNDFITPGVACIKTVDENGGGSDRPQQQVEIEIDGTGQAIEVTKEGSATRLQKASISLADCLACSGCITSAEEVLVAQHSHKEFLNALKEHRDDKLFVASISHQTRASLAAALSISVEDTDRILIKLLVDKLGFSKVVGTGLGRKISLRQMSKGVISERFGDEFERPKLSSTCPGWVMYVEKTHPFLLPHMDRAKSPQQITGLLLKRLAAREYGVKPDQIYHLSIMPCFDKKLEAARTESDSQVDVDCVITPRELVQLLEDERIDVEALLSEAREDPKLWDMSNVYECLAPRNWLKPIDSWLNDEGSASGGYAFHYLKELANHYVTKLGVNEEFLKIQLIQGRNSDIYELELVNTESSESLGKSAVINGFRNIQNMVRKIKQPGKKVLGNARGRIANRRRQRETGKKDSVGTSVDPQKCDLIEVMACPDGCINGGGQISGPSNHISSKEWVNRVLKAYESIPLGTSIDSEELEQWVTKWLDEFTVCDSRLLKTRFRNIEPPKDTTTIALTSTW